jgi:hypothetical protein
MLAVIVMPMLGGPSIFVFVTGLSFSLRFVLWPVGLLLAMLGFTMA